MDGKTTVRKLGPLNWEYRCPQNWSVSGCRTWNEAKSRAQLHWNTWHTGSPHS